MSGQVNYLLDLLLLIRNVANTESHSSQKAKVIFKHPHPFLSTGRNKSSCPNYIIDHIDPLACGGEDAPDNMQGQNIEEPLAKGIDINECR